MKDQGIDLFDDVNSIDELQDFYCTNIDDVLLKKTLREKMLYGDTGKYVQNILEALLKRDKWKIIYNHPFRTYDKPIHKKCLQDFKKEVKDKIVNAINSEYGQYKVFVSVQTEDKLKGMEDSQVKFLARKHNNADSYRVVRDIEDLNDTFIDIRRERVYTYYLRIYVDPKLYEGKKQDMINAIEECNIDDFFRRI